MFLDMCVYRGVCVCVSVCVCGCVCVHTVCKWKTCSARVLCANANQCVHVVLLLEAGGVM